jgi:hypothetical protein
MKPGRLCNGEIKPSDHDYKQVVWMDSLPRAFKPAIQVRPSTIRLADESSAVGRTQQNQDPAYKDTPDKEGRFNSADSVKLGLCNAFVS